MKKRKKTWLLALFILLAAILFASVTTFNYRQGIVIHQALYDVASQFSKLQNWKNWHIAFKDNNDTISFVSNNKTQEASFPWKEKYSIHISNPAAIEINQTKNNTTTVASLAAIPYKDGSSTYLEWNEKINMYTWVQRKLFNRDIVKESLANLKAFLEDDNHKYGFPIKIIPVKDTLILTKVMTIMPGDIKKNVPLLFSQLKNYIISNHIAETADFYFVSYNAANDKQVDLAVGIPVHTELSHEDGFRFLRLPLTGRLLEGKYQGPYSARQKLYDAMDKYIMDKKLKKVALPLEKYPDTFTKIDDSAQVAMTLFYPVY